MGSTKQDLWGVDVQLLNDGEVYMKKLAISFLDRKTEGIEYVQELDSSFDVAEWVTLAKYVRSKYSFRNLGLRYDMYAKKGSGYSWMAGVEMKHSKQSDKYLLPVSTLEADNCFWNLYAKKNFELCEKSSLLAGVNVGYNSNLDGEYNYTGAYETSETVTNMYRNDFMYLVSDYYRFGAEATYSTFVSDLTSLFVKAQFQYWAPKDSDFDRRTYTGLSVGITF